MFITVGGGGPGGPPPGDLGFWGVGIILKTQGIICSSCKFSNLFMSDFWKREGEGGGGGGAPLIIRIFPKRDYLHEGRIILK